jgi:hypothetical protein
MRFLEKNFAQNNFFADLSSLKERVREKIYLRFIVKGSPCPHSEGTNKV